MTEVDRTPAVSSPGMPNRPEAERPSTSGATPWRATLRLRRQVLRVVADPAAVPPFEDAAVDPRPLGDLPGSAGSRLPDPGPGLVHRVVRVGGRDASPARPTRRPQADVFSSIQWSATFESPRSSYQPPTPEWTPANQTCSMVWPSAASASSHGHGSKSRRRSSMASAWYPNLTSGFSVWSCHFLPAFIASESTVPQTPMNSTGQSRPKVLRNPAAMSSFPSVL